MSVSKTIVINCAGRGTRLGLNRNKALIDIDGKPLIIRQLECMDKFDDIRVVVGYQAQDVINTVCSYRKDVVFVFNHAYKETRTAASLSLGKKYPNEMVISVDGDVVLNPETFEKFVLNDEEAIGVCLPYTKEPVYVKTEFFNNEEYAVKFSREEGKYEWTGLLKILSSRMNSGNDHVYKLITPNLPLKVINVNLKEIDNMEEYENAVKWYKNNYK
ncbi:NTP transferase domain-containing protein [Romboutsia lituseburensis]|uniref:Choline kinase n=1 Tax=Romboutsia lituseburensis DSM 797 TaxID=1121325 RepID=A0A1G9P9K0_9FIRM|nr:NTP transferase domain-containing protein [Romboutsia lituseburensis]CEH33295.1 HAD super hydrolase/phosphatase [Romboutsia lituseburensis]SDL95374.1 Choline kinase [Romboutsia lituseburensis DSM 797]